MRKISFLLILMIAGVVLAAGSLDGSQVNKSVSNAQDKDTLSDEPGDITGDVIPLKDTKLIIEHNAKDKDTGFQCFIDSGGWNEITVTGPGGKVLTFKGEGQLGELGLTELFFETVEPANADVPIPEVLKVLPEGNYTVMGSAIEVGERQGTTMGTAWLTHNIPKGPVLLLPEEGATVPLDDLLVRWNPVTKTLDCSAVNIISYQLIIEKDETPHKHMIGKRGLSMYLPASVTQIRIPTEFFEPNTNYNWEVLAIEESGNQALTSSNFSTGGVVDYKLSLEKKRAKVTSNYNTLINPDDFTIKIDNPYFSLPVGKKMVYEAQTEDGLERIEILIPGWTKEIMGVKTLVFWDRVYLDGELIEDTRDYLAQHKETGDVWYFGEHVDNYEGGKLIDHHGAWFAGVDDAKPGIWVLANPKVGDYFRNEYLIGEAEDESLVVGVGETVTTPYGTFTDCVKYLDGSPLFPQKAYTYHCKDKKVRNTVAEIELDENMDVNQRVELVSVDQTGALGIHLPQQYANEGVNSSTITFDDANAFIEFNSEDDDYGFHVELDGKPWREVKIISPDSEKLFEVNNQGCMAEQGLTSLFFESAELEVDELSRDEFLARFPEGEYILAGETIEGELLMSTMTVTHDIPNPPVIVSPRQDEVVLKDNVVIEWEPVTSPAGIKIDIYQLVFSPVDPPKGEPLTDLNIDLTFEVPSDVTEVPIPSELLMASTEYQVAVYAKEDSGNQVYSEITFVTSN